MPQAVLIRNYFLASCLEKPQLCINNKGQKKRKELLILIHFPFLGYFRGRCKVLCVSPFFFETAPKNFTRKL